MVIFRSISIFLFLILLSAFPAHAAKKNKSPYLYELAAVVVFQNEAPWLKEWIEYHKLIGFEHFYLCNNLSTDNYMEVLTPYINSGEVELFHYNYESRNLDEHIAYTQLPAFMDTVFRTAGHVKWLAIMDADEFITPLKTKSLLDVLKNYEDVGGVYINWLNFGTSHVYKIPENKLMIESLTYSARQPISVGKSIVRPDRVAFLFSPHTAAYHPPYGHVNTNRVSSPAGPGDPDQFPIADDQLLIFHYYTRDIDHVMNVKFPRRVKWTSLPGTPEEYVASLEVLNATYRPNMKRFVPYLRAKMKK
jgi:hypothetical protein